MALKRPHDAKLATTHPASIHKAELVQIQNHTTGVFEPFTPRVIDERREFVGFGLSG
jgi:hypothetical protein